MKPILILALTSIDLFAATYVADIQQTNTQAVIHVSTDQDGSCTYRISEANNFLPLVHDIDGSLFPASDSDARAGSVVYGGEHWFVAGTRTSAKATDGRFYSRALAANTSHYGGVTCADAEVPFTFTTNNIFTGNTFADPIPFDAAALGNYAIPTVDYTNQLTDYIDPEKGLKFKLATLPGQYTFGANILTAGLLTTYSPGSVDRRAGGAFDVNRANVAPLDMETAAAVQYYFANLLSYNGMNTNDGRYARRLTTALGRYGAQDTYSNAKIIEGSNVLTFPCSTPNLQRVEDICIAKMPPDPPAEAGNDFLGMPVAVPGGHVYAEAQFGYAEFGAADSFYCTTRQEPCNTSSPLGTPFNWEGETRQPAACSAGCNVKVPVLPDHVVYYRIRTSDDGTTWSKGATQLAVDPGGIQ